MHFLRALNPKGNAKICIYTNWLNRRKWEQKNVLDVVFYWKGIFMTNNQMMTWWFWCTSIKNTKLREDVTMYYWNREVRVETLRGIFFEKLLLEGVLLKRHINEDPTLEIWCKRTKIIAMVSLLGTWFN